MSLRLVYTGEVEVVCLDMIALHKIFPGKKMGELISLISSMRTGIEVATFVEKISAFRMTVQVFNHLCQIFEPCITL